MDTPPKISRIDTQNDVGFVKKCISGFNYGFILGIYVQFQGEKGRLT